MAGRWPSPDISPGHPRSLGDPRQEPIVYCEHRVQFGRRGYAELWRVLGGHIGHARLANRIIYWLRRSSPICLAQSSATISRPDEISGLAHIRVSRVAADHAVSREDRPVLGDSALHHRDPLLPLAL